MGILCVVGFWFLIVLMSVLIIDEENLEYICNIECVKNICMKILCKVLIVKFLFCVKYKLCLLFFVNILNEWILCVNFWLKYMYLIVYLVCYVIVY